MKKTFLAGVAVLAIAGSTAVYAQHRGFDGPGRHHHMRMNPEDRAAFLDARIAAVKAGLKLTPEQDQLWLPLEAAVRGFAKLRIDRANARMEAREERRDERRSRRDEDRDMRRDDRAQDRDPIARLHQRADRMGETAAALKRIAEAADPLYKTLDDGQKRRLAMLTRMAGKFGGKHGGWRRDLEGFDRDVDHGMDHDMDRHEERGGSDRGGRDHEMRRDRDQGPDRL